MAVEVELDATAVIFLVSSNFDLFGIFLPLLMIVETFWCKSLILDCFTATEE